MPPAEAASGTADPRLHVLHVSTPAGARLVARAKLEHQDASCETCPHYLVLTPQAVARIGPAAKCAPPIREASSSASSASWSARFGQAG